MNGPKAPDLFGHVETGGTAGKLGKEFLFPPFSALDARCGAWQERKGEWLALGIQSELGRAAPCIHAPLKGWNGKGADPESGEYEKTEWISVFDPVLCELAVRWFSPPGGTVLDPFAGGSVRGIVAAVLGRNYRGIELRGEQVQANIAQATKILGGNYRGSALWLEGDSREELEFAPPADLVFSCPPYGDLERYSDDPRDLSTLGHDDFFNAHAEIIRKACAALRENRFAVWVVGEYRLRDGRFAGFVPRTVEAFERAGLKFYNDGILLTMVGSASMRAAAQFRASRKFCKTHQNVLVFVKGDPFQAARACAESEAK